MEALLASCCGRVGLALLALTALPEHAQAQSEVSGQVRYYSGGAAVPAVVVALDGVGSTASYSDLGGAFAFADPGPGDWQLTPSKLGDRGAGVSALDATWTLQAVVGSRTFTAQQRLACDVTGDGSISALDAARMLQLVAGMRDRLPVAETCGSDFAFVPDPASALNQSLVTPQMAPVCVPGAIAFTPLSPPVAGQDFLAILFGDCTGNWQAPGTTPTATATPVDTVTPLDTATSTATATWTAPPPTATWTATASASATPPPTATASGTRTTTSTATRTFTAAIPPSATVPPTATLSPTRTKTPTPSATGTNTQTQTPSITDTRTPTNTRTATRTSTPTRTATATLVPSATTTNTPTRTGTRTQTATPTATPSPTPTQTCVSGLAWNVSAPLTISQQSGGEVWLTRTIPTDSGWGIFWLRQDPGATNFARLYYAHVDLAGQITVAPTMVIQIPKIAFRAHYYMVAWNGDHFGLLTAENATLYYQSMTTLGALSHRHPVGPTLFVSPVYDQESDGDIDAFPGGFLGVVEGECAGHSCAYAFKLDANGTATSAVVNLVDFDLTHQFYPAAAFDGAGFAILSVKDIKIADGGTMTRYWPLTGVISGHKKVPGDKEYLWDEFPDIAWNGGHFAALWTENSARSHSAPWQIHFATFARTASNSIDIADRVIDTVAEKTNHRWTTQVHPMGADWVAQYTSRTATNGVIAVYELLGSDAQSGLVLEPFTMSADALGSNPHFAPGHAGTLGITRGSSGGGGTSVEFHTLPPPSCQ